MLEYQKRPDRLLEIASGIIKIYGKNLKIAYVTPAVIRIFYREPDDACKGGGRNHPVFVYSPGSAFIVT
jgi:hypothetical protein